MASNKNAGKFLSGISVGLSLLLLLSAILFSNIPTSTSYLYENGRIVAHSWKSYFRMAENLVLCFSVAALVVSTAISMIEKITKREKGIKGLLRPWLVGLLCICMVMFSDSVAFGLFGEEYDPEWYEFSDGQHTIVIEEKSFLLGGWATVYQVQKDQTATVIGSFSTDDGFRNKGAYEVNWFVDRAEITYLFGPGGTKVETVQFAP